MSPNYAKKTSPINSEKDPNFSVKYPQFPPKIHNNFNHLEFLTLKSPHLAKPLGACGNSGWKKDSLSITAIPP